MDKDIRYIIQESRTHEPTIYSLIFSKGFPLFSAQGLKGNTAFLLFYESNINPAISLKLQLAMVTVFYLNSQTTEMLVDLELWEVQPPKSIPRINNSRYS